MSIHPIVPVCGKATYNTAKFITKILQNHYGKVSSFVKDSTYFTQKMRHLSIDPGEVILVSFDLSALFTSIPVPVALQVINSKISTCTSFTIFYKIPTEKFIKLLEITSPTASSTSIRYSIKQLQGAALGSPVSSIIANT